SCCSPFASLLPACGRDAGVLRPMIAPNRSLSYVKHAWKVPGHSDGPGAGSFGPYISQARPRRLMSCLSSRVSPARQVPTSPRREASLFHLPDLTVRHFLFGGTVEPHAARRTARAPRAGSATKPTKIVSCLLRATPPEPEGSSCSARSGAS